MKIIEGMKKIKLNEKKITDNISRIQQYASKLSSEMAYFKTDEEQKKQIKSLIQANIDLVTEIMKLKRQINITNLLTRVEIDKFIGSIDEALMMKRKYCQLLISTFNALTDGAASTRLRSAPSFDGKLPQVLRLYDEATKNECIRRYQDLLYTIDSRLEVINATTELIESDIMIENVIK